MKPGFGLKGAAEPRGAETVIHRRQWGKTAALKKAKADHKRIPKTETPERCAAFLAFVRSQPCIVSGARTGIEAHHQGPRGSKAMGAKVSDFLAVPLHQLEHRYWHDHGHLRGMTRAESESLMATTQKRLRAYYERNEEP